MAEEFQTTAMTDFVPPVLPQERRPGRIIAAVLAIVAAGGGIWYYLDNVKSVEALAQPVYKELTVQRGNLTVGVSETGTATIAYETVKSEFKSTVSEVLVRAGQTVAAGDVLLTLDQSDLADELYDQKMTLQKAQLAYKQAQLDHKTGQITARYTLEAAQSAGASAQATLDQTLSELKKEMKNAYYKQDDIYDEIDDIELKIDELKDDYAEVIAKYATDPNSLDADEKSSYNRYLTQLTKYQKEIEDLEDSIDSAEDDYDAVKLAYRAKELKAQEAYEKSLLEAEMSEQVYANTLEQLEYNLESARLTLETAQKDYADLQALAATGQIVAPCDGVVMQLNVAKGDSVGDSTSLATVMDKKTVYMSVSISQDDITSLTLGQKANITIDAYDEQQMTGTIWSISVSPVRAASSTVSYAVTVLLDEVPRDVYEGMSGYVTFVTREVSGALILSNRAVTNEKGVSYVLLKGEDGQPVKTEVTTGFSDGVNVEVTGGLKEGDIVLIQGQVAAR